MRLNPTLLCVVVVPFLSAAGKRIRGRGARSALTSSRASRCMLPLLVSWAPPAKSSVRRSQSCGVSTSAFRWRSSRNCTGLFRRAPPSLVLCPAGAATSSNAQTRAPIRTGVHGRRLGRSCGSIRRSTLRQWPSSSDEMCSGTLGAPRLMRAKSDPVRRGG